MRAKVDLLIRACVATQVAAYEFLEEDVRAVDSKALGALKICHKEIGALIKWLEKEAR